MNMRRLMGLATLGLIVSPVIAQNDNDILRQKYKLRVLVHCGAHNWLGDQFREDLCVNLRSTLQDALGGAADVEVTDFKKIPSDKLEKWWQEVHQRGLAALDLVTGANGDKTHFVRIDFRNGCYELECRQIDGSTGVVSPLRREQTEDRAFVTRLTGLMIAQDFGIVGAVEGRGDTVTVSFKGGALSSVNARWVRQGDVFALVYMPPGSARGSRVPDTLVQMLQDPEGGKAQCRVVYRPQQNPLAQFGSSGFVCVKLPATHASLRLRILDENGQVHNKAMQIRVHPEAFQRGESAEEEVLSPDPTGLFISRRPYDRIAFVRVVTGAQQIARLPVPIFEDRSVIAKLRIDPAAEELGQLQEAKRNLLQMYNEALVVQIERMKQTAAYVKLDKLDEALAYAKVSRRTLEQDVERLGSHADSLKKDIGTQPISLDEAVQYVQAFSERKSSLNRLIFDLEQAVLEKNDPARQAKEAKLKSLFTQGQVHESNFDIDLAIAVYEQIQKEFGAQKVVSDRLEKLRNEWAIRSPDHQAARDFVYKEWTQVRTAAETEAKLPKARDAVQKLRESGDSLSLFKLRLTLPEQVKVLTDDLRRLAASENPEDMDKVSKAKKFAEDFDKFAQEVEAAISALTKK